VEGEPTFVTIDIDAFSQALENLLSNAVKYSGERREAEVVVRFGERRTEVTVRDYGIGIARKNRKRIFERFHRVEDEMTRKTGGTGLGLTLARDLVRGFGGDIKVRSRLGEGSRFTIVLPREKLRGKENGNDTVTRGRG
jgi:signal transduction histidine kinase